jgi:hypothetical protein
MLAYTAIFLASLAGYAQASATVVVIGALTLATLSGIENVRLYRKAAARGAQARVDGTLMASLLNALAATALAYAGGFLLGVLAA